MDWSTSTVVDGDLLDRTKAVRRMQQTRARALFDAPRSRLWTLTPPPWWVAEETSITIWPGRVELAS